MTNAENKYKIVYRMDYAMALKKKGHKLTSTMPNPKDNRYNIFIFEDDCTLEADLKALIGNNSRMEG